MAPVCCGSTRSRRRFVGAAATPTAALGQRIFGAFLTWLQEKQAEVFVVATANDLSALPPELLRKGRFDEIFFVDLPTPRRARGDLAHPSAPAPAGPGGFDLPTLAAATDGFSGAEIEQVVIAASLQAIHDGRPLDTDMLVAEARATVPLARSRREDVATLREYARERFVPVS